jgi:hypothetical protein
LSSEHFSVDGTLLEVWASLKSFRPKDGERQRNDTHGSTTDPEARLFRKSLPLRKQGDGQGSAAVLPRPRADGTA